jgi:uncharacterized FlaG/YvyC family protein
MEIDVARLSATETGAQVLLRKTAAAEEPAKKHEQERENTPAPRVSVPIPNVVRERDVNVHWSGQVMILQFVDKQTGTLVQQIPSEEVLRVVRNLQELLQRQAAAQESPK